MPNPAVSVIVCCYNSVGTLGRTLETLSGQTFDDFEIVAIDDGSTDQTASLLKQAAVSELRMRLLENAANRGTAFTRQRGLNEARAPLVMFVDADDLAAPNLVERLYEAVVADEALLGVGCYSTYFTEEGTDLGFQRIGPTSREQFQRLNGEAKMMFMAPVTLFRKSDALEVGGYRQTLMPNPDGIRYEDFSEDLDLWCRMSDLGSNGRYFLTLSESLLRYRKPLESLSTKNLKYMQLKMRWIKDCLRRRRAGQPERSLADFLASRTLEDRFGDWRSDRAAAFYKRAGFAYAQRRYARLAALLFLAGVMSPKLLRQKYATQRVIQ